MLVSALITFSIACLAVCLSCNVQEEIVKVAAASVALICLVVSLIFAPLAIKVLIVLLPAVASRLS